MFNMKVYGYYKHLRKNTLDILLLVGISTLALPTRELSTVCSAQWCATYCADNSTAQ